MQRRRLIKAFTLTASIVAMGMTWTVQAAETIKVGILHSLSGTMAISETSLKDMALMTIDEINAKGGVNGKHARGRSWSTRPPTGRCSPKKGRQLLTQDKVAVVFGCWTSVSRKSVLPVFEELNGLLFYPVQYEGEEMSPNVFYTGAAPNQQAIPAVEYLMSEDGGSAKRFVLLGTDYVYPRTTNKILRAFLHTKGVADKDIHEVYTPFGHSDYQTIVSNLKKFSAGGKTAVISTVNGDSNVPFYKELANQGHESHRRAGDCVLGGRRRTARHRHQTAGGQPRSLELLPVGGKPGQPEICRRLESLRQGNTTCRAPTKP
jgi:urea transport system substrate-binding protein